MAVCSKTYAQRTARGPSQMYSSSSKEPTCELELFNKARSSSCRSRSDHVHPGSCVAASDTSGLSFVLMRDVLLQQCERRALTA